MSILAYLEFTFKSLMGRFGRLMAVVCMLSISLLVVFALNVGVSLFKQIEESTLNTPRSFTTLEIHLEDPNIQGSQSVSARSFKNEDFTNLSQDSRVRSINSHIYVLADDISIEKKEVLDQGMVIEIPDDYKNNIRIAEGRLPETEDEVLIGEGWLDFPSVQLESQEVLGKDLTVSIPNFYNPEESYEYSFKVVGVESVNDIDSDSIRITESKAHKLYNESRDKDVAEEVSRLDAGNIIVQLFDNNDIKSFAQEWTKRGYFLTTSEDTLNIIRDSYDSYQRYIYLFSTGILVTIGIIVFLSMNLLVRERYREIGVLKALGARKKVIATFYIFQGITMAALSALVGTIVFLLFIYALRHGWISSLPEELYAAPYSFGKILIIDFALLLVAALGSAIPARKAAKLDAVDAISSV